MVVLKCIGGNGIYNQVVGGRVKFGSSDIKSKWKAHIKYGNPDFTPQTITEILGLSEEIDDPKLLENILKLIWEEPIEKLFNGISKSLELDESLITARRTLFWKIKELIEIVILIHLRLVQKKNIKKLIKKWDNIKIDTSSKILWSLFGKNNTQKENYFPNINFTYIGYCPKVPNERIKLLLEFPLDNLINDINKVDNKFNIDFSNILENTNKIQLNISYNFSDIIKPKINKVNPFLNEFMKCWLELVDKLKPYLKKKEEHNIKIAQHMDELSKKLDDINIRLKNYIE
jgi:hypothetical protein